MDNSVMDNTPDANQTQAADALQQTERMLPQSKVNEIVGAAKQEAAERAVEAYKRQQQAQSQPNDHASSNSNNTQRALSEDDVKRLTSEEFSRHHDKLAKDAEERANAETAQRIVKNFWDKIAPGKEKYEDFEAVTSSIELMEFPNMVQLLADHVDNSHDVLYELGKNQSKLWTIEAMATTKPQLAIREIKRLSDSIKANEASSQLKSSKSPLSQNRPSNTGTDSGNTLSMRDLKAKYRA